MREWLSDFIGETGGDPTRGIGLLRADGDPYEIVAYRSYANATRALVHGRVLEDPSASPATESDSLWRDLMNTAKRAEADPVPQARVLVSVAGVESEIRADDEGFFCEWIDFPEPLVTRDLWRDAEPRLLDPLRANQPDLPSLFANSAAKWKGALSRGTPLGILVSGD